MYDMIVVGGGPAGMTAALYALRNGKTVLVIEKNGFGGQITNSPKVENYPGSVSISGNELAEKMLDQILAQGAEIEFDKVISVTVKDPADDVAAVSQVDGVAPQANGEGATPAAKRPVIKVVTTEEGAVYEALTVVLATGVKHRLLGLEGETDLIGEGISFCAVCDGDFYTGKKVLVAGGGNSALQEAILLAEKSEEVIMLQDLPIFTGEQRLQDVLFSRPNVRSYTNQKITQLLSKTLGDGSLKFLGVKTLDKATGEERTFYADGLFVAIGLIPENEPFKDLAKLNSYGYFDSDEDCLSMTEGVFVAGDCRSKKVRQVTTAAADGAVAALAACRYINEMK